MSNAPHAARYWRHPRVRFLRTMAFASYPDAPAALRDPAFAVPHPDETATILFNDTNFFELNLVSALIWDLLSAPGTPDELAGVLVATFGIARETALQDIEGLLAELCAQDLLTSELRA